MKKKICFVVAVPSTATAFLRDHILALSNDYDVYLAGNIKEDKEVEGLAIKQWKHIDICRNISLWRDIKAVRQLHKYFKIMNFDAIHSVTPKAGLLSSIAGKLTSIKHRTHIFTGQVWATKKGFTRWLLKNIDKIIVKLNNHILVDGESQRAFLVNEKVMKDKQGIVFGHGSISGVNSKRFVPNIDVRMQIRKELNIPEDMVVYIFLGRLNVDKGIRELYEAFNKLAKENKKVFLLLVGSDESNFYEKAKNYENIKEGENFIYYGRTPSPEDTLNAGDVFVLPTYREGFGSSVLEAACIGLPAICSDAYGVQDAYIEGETGLKCKVGDSESLYKCMKQILDSPEMRKKMGEKSRERALKDFRGEDLTKAWVEFYQSLLK